MKKTILVTGGAGFLGSHLCDRLLDEGFAVVAMDNLLTGSTDNIAHLIGSRDFHFIRHDVTDYIYLDDPLHAVVHFASPASPPVSCPITLFLKAASFLISILGLPKVTP